MEAGRLRLRPILMTAFAFILGVAAADVRDRRRRGEPAVDRHDGVWRHARGDAADADFRPGLLRPHRAGARSARAATPRAAPHPRRARAKPAPKPRNESRSFAMRVLKLASSPRSIAAIGAGVDRRHVRGAATGVGAPKPPRRRMMAMPVPVVAGDQEDDADLSRLFGRTEALRSITLAGAVVRLSRGAARARRRRREERRSALQDRSARLAGRARSSESAGAARQPRRSTMRAPISIAARS